MWWRSLGLAAVLALAACQVRPLYQGTATSGPLSPLPDLRAIVVDPPRDRTEQVLTNELKFLFRGDGGDPAEELYRLRILADASNDPLAVELEEDLPAAVLVTLNATFILSEVASERTLLTGSSTTSASYDFSSQRFANVRAEKDAEERAARAMAENISARVAAYFAARRSDT
ncbi:LPS assembly lipoprotein LptE [Acuticoccus sp.]|uniref:LPS assembly lipoprotein LptE n=1 Tax=Acuticoccus sp. TaxID=1904378 RepID=UPI003B52631F